MNIAFDGTSQMGWAYASNEFEVTTSAGTAMQFKTLDTQTITFDTNNNGNDLTIGTTGTVTTGGNLVVNGQLNLGAGAANTTWEIRTKRTDGVDSGLDDCDAGSVTQNDDNTLCFEPSDVGATAMKLYQTGNLVIAGTTTTGSNPDIAEQFPVNDPSINEGDILVATNPTDLSHARQHDNVLTTKAFQPYQSAMVGAVSTDPSMLIGIENSMQLGRDNRVINGDQRAVVIAGRIPVKVSTINGAINAGDNVTSSTIPGFGMLADRPGMIVGRAMQGVSNGSTQGESIACPTGTPSTVTCAKIIILLNMAWVDPSATSSLSETTVSHDVFLANQLRVGIGGLKVAGSLEADGGINFVGGKIQHTGNKATYSTAGTGYAEHFNAANPATKPQSGELVAITSGNQGVDRAPANGSRVVGVVTDHAGFIGNSSDHPDSVRVVLMGQTSTKVTNQGGPIVPGDYLAASTIPGVAKKAAMGEPVFGLALEPYDNVSVGSINVVVSASNPLTGIGSLPANQLAAVPVNVVEQLTVQGALIVGGPAEFRGPAVFKAMAEFIDRVIFRNDVLFEGQAEFAKAPTFNNDTAGTAVIRLGQKQVRVDFGQEFASEPVVSTTLNSGPLRTESYEAYLNTEICTLEEGPVGCEQKLKAKLLSTNVRFVITDQSATGFTVELETEAEQDIRFNWTAIQVKDRRDIISQDPEESQP